MRTHEEINRNHLQKPDILTQVRTLTQAVSEYSNIWILMILLISISVIRIKNYEWFNEVFRHRWY